MSLNPKILEVLACPVCKGKLLYNRGYQVLICKYDKIYFPIEDGMPIMLEQRAKPVIEAD